MSLLLAIESAIAGGSLSFQRDGKPVASWHGTTGVSRAEELLPAVTRLMRENDIERGDLSIIAVSAGPGSFTGIRIGISTAMGLASALSIPLATCSILKAMAYSVGAGHLLTAVPMGRGAVCVQEFQSMQPAGEPATMTQDEFVRQASAFPGGVVIHGGLIELCKHLNIMDLGLDLAAALGKYCHQYPDERERPLFISKSF